MPNSRFQHPAFNLAAKIFWRIPGCFGVARLLGPSYSLRCVVFHNISASESPFTAGMNVSTTPQKFEAALEFLTSYYKPVSLEDVLAAANGKALPPRAVLVTFDDAYASVVQVAAPVCRKFGVPAVFFINAAFLDNKRLAPDNLVCYLANVKGMASINEAARSVRSKRFSELRSLPGVFTHFFPTLTLAEREVFLESLRQSGSVNENRLAKDAGLYLTSEQLRSLASFDFEIGNHTYTHVYCRSLSQDDLRQEVDKNKEVLEGLSGRKVRSFSQPYGSSKDLTPELASHLKQSGHEAAFLSESATNTRKASVFHVDRINSRVESDESFFFELEILPRLRTIRNQFFRNSRGLPGGSEVPREIQIEN